MANIGHVETKYWDLLGKACDHLSAEEQHALAMVRGGYAQQKLAIEQVQQLELEIRGLCTLEPRTAAESQNPAPFYDECRRLILKACAGLVAAISTDQQSPFPRELRSDRMAIL